MEKSNGISQILNDYDTPWLTNHMYERHRESIYGTIYHEEVIDIYSGRGIRMGELTRDVGTQGWLMWDETNHCRGNFNTIEEVMKALEEDYDILTPLERKKIYES